MLQISVSLNFFFIQNGFPSFINIGIRLNLHQTKPEQETRNFPTNITTHVFGIICCNAKRKFRYDELNMDERLEI